VLSAHAGSRRDTRYIIADRTRADVSTAILLADTAGASSSRKQLADALQVSQPTITKVVDPLIRDKYVVEGSPSLGPHLGRPARSLHINKKRCYVLGVKVKPWKLGDGSGGTRLFDTLTNLAIKSLTMADCILPTTDQDAIVDGVVLLARDLQQHVPSRRANDIISLDVELGGHIDGWTGVIRYAPSMNWPTRPFHLSERLQNETGLCVTLENDINALALYEQWFGHGRSIDSFAVIGIANDAVGCGMVIGGQLLRGSTGMAGEIGHYLVGPCGEEYPCGRQGCLATVVLADINRLSRRIPDIKRVAILADQGNPAAMNAFVNAGNALGWAMGTLASIVNPMRIILSYQEFVPPKALITAIKETYLEHVYVGGQGDCEIIYRSHCDNDGARGAAAAALQCFMVASFAEPHGHV
jgi:predicted NBD/HSP70 family sugar kinase